MTAPAPKPASRPEGAGILQRIRLFRQDMFASQPDKLYRAWMAETRTPFYRSFLINDPALVKRVLRQEPENFPKSAILHDSLRDLLGDSVFLSNGETWKRQRRILDPAFEQGARRAFPAMRAAGAAAVERLATRADGQQTIEMEFEASMLAADVIFRTLFSLPITADTATRVFYAFRRYQRAQPLWNLPGLLRLPRWMPRLRPRAAGRAAREIRQLLAGLVNTRAAEIAAGQAPDDLATRIMTLPDPQTGTPFTAPEMLDQVAIFFLAGHETSASALGWALYLLAAHPEIQKAAAAEAKAAPELADLANMPRIKAVFRETLRLYPPVPMMVREAARPCRFRDRDVPAGSPVLLSPWHLHRHQRLWHNPDVFDPARWETDNGRQCQRDAYIPFSAGPRVCSGAGFAMIEGVLLLSMLLARFRFDTAGDAPVPVAHLTVRARDGITLRLSPRV